VDVSGGDAQDTKSLGDLAEPMVAGAVAPPEGPLQLDPETLTAESGEEVSGRLDRRRPRSASLEGTREKAVTGTAGETDESFGVRLERLQVHPCRAQLTGPPGTGVGVSRREETTEVGVAGRVLDQQRHVDGDRATVGHHRDLGARDRPDAQTLCRVGEVHRAPEAVVVGQGEGLVAEPGGGTCQLGGRRGAVQEGEGRVGVELDVGGRHTNVCSLRDPPRLSTRSAPLPPLRGGRRSRGTQHPAGIPRRSPDRLPGGNGRGVRVR
jgi:hypothetical protein